MKVDNDFQHICSRCKGKKTISVPGDKFTEEYGVRTTLFTSIACPDCDGVGWFDKIYTIDTKNMTINDKKIKECKPLEWSITNKFLTSFTLENGRELTIIGGQARWVKK